jgi:hypothetical protein
VLEGVGARGGLQLGYVSGGDAGLEVADLVLKANLVQL